MHPICKRAVLAVSTLTTFLLLVAAFAVSSASVQQASHDDYAAVKEANEKFFVALNDMFAGDPTPMQDAWWHTVDVVYMGIGGNHLVGWKNVYANWQKKASQNLGGHAKAEQVQTTSTTQTTPPSMVISLNSGPKCAIIIRRENRWPAIRG